MKTLEEAEEEMNAYRQSRRYKIDKILHKLNKILTFPKRFYYEAKDRYQRATRGYSDRDCWNGDAFLAGQIAGVLTWLVNNSHGVSMAYWNEDDGDPWEPDTAIMVERRDKEYLHYASIFAEYAKNGCAWDEDWKKEFGGVFDTEIDIALQWFREHFLELWD